MENPNYHEDYYIRVLFEKVKLREVMTVPVITINEEEDFSLAEEIFLKNNIFYLPVVDKNNKLSGLISHKYLYKTQSPRKMIEEVNQADDVLIDGDSFYNRETLNSYILQNVMINDPFTLGPDVTLSEGVLSLSRRKIGCIPIVDKNHKVCGIFTTQNIITYISRILVE